MRVRCGDRSNLIYGSEEIFLEKLQKFSLIENKEYLVYGLSANEKSLWYSICNEDYSYFPYWIPSSLFEIVESHLSRFWVYSYREGDRTPLDHRWTFPEWANDPDFFDRLTDCEVQEIEIFRKYKERMDLEFPDPKVTELAQIGDENWLICPKCIDAWESRNTIDALVKCPKCEKIYNNPRYDKDWRMRNNL